MTATQRSVRDYDAKIWNLPETPEMFHRQAPGLPMTTPGSSLVAASFRSCL